MWITSDQAAEVYARFCKARYGNHAIDITRKRAAELRKLGDAEGERIWKVVTQKIESGSVSKLNSAA